MVSNRIRDLGHIDEAACRRFQSAVEFAGRKWVGAVLLAGVRGARRFSEYRDTVDGISDRVLAVRLRELEAEGLIERRVQPTMPVTISYTPSTKGLQLMELLQPLVDWSIAGEPPAEPAAAGAAETRRRVLPLASRPVPALR